MTRSGSWPTTIPVARGEIEIREDRIAISGDARGERLRLHGRRRRLKPAALAKAGVHKGCGAC
jgi:hypothetical protein